MKTIVLAATKGGTGKSTVAFNLGIEAAKHGSVFWADLDPQKSLTMLSEARDRSGRGEGGPVLLDGVKNLETAKADLERSPYARDFLIADTPGSHMAIIANAIRAADVIVLPCQPSPLDIIAQEDIAPLIVELGKSACAVFAVNKVDGRASIADTLERIAPIFPNAPVRINQRQAYMRGAINGLSGPEVNPKECGPEISALWAAITATLRKTDATIRHERSSTRRAEKEPCR